MLIVAAAETPFRLAPAVSLGGRHHFGQVHAGQAGETARQFQRFCGSGSDVRLAGDDGAALRTFFTQNACQLARIDAGDGNDIRLLQVRIERLGGTEIRYQPWQITNDQAGGVNPGGFDILFIDAGIADMRVSESDDLAAIAWIGEDFLVAGHGGIEYDFASRMTNGAN